jgi:CTP:molybdopterin cytidylyltransferase MocA
MKPMTFPTLLVLAAGMGSRYGGLKQIDPVGPGGETIMEGKRLSNAPVSGRGFVVHLGNEPRNRCVGPSTAECSGD